MSRFVGKLYLRTCATSEDSDQTAHAQSDQNHRCAHFCIAKAAKFIMRTTKILIRLRGCAGRFVSWLGTYVSKYVSHVAGQVSLLYFCYTVFLCSLVIISAL